VKIACVAQIVNTISPIHTTRDGLLKHTTYYPIMLFSKLASGLALDVEVKAPTYSTAKFGEMPLLDVSASYDPATTAGAVFIVNRSLSDSLTVELIWQDRVPSEICGAHQVSGTDPKAFNSFADPQAIAAKSVPKPVVEGKRATMVVPPLSFTALETRT
jgi:alpha-N-arabinofuranosidase